MQRRGSSSIRGRSRLYCVKAANVHLFAVCLNAGAPFFAYAMPSNASYADRAVLARASILRVDVLVSIPQIAQPIVACVAVDVVDYA
jgi:hypothetical protein